MVWNSRMVENQKEKAQIPNPKEKGKRKEIYEDLKGLDVDDG